MATIKELTEQNSFLVAQLSQVQRDLERYYLENLQLLQSNSGVPVVDDSLTRTWLQFHPQEFWIDLRRESLHENWYEAEVHGRWAGPNPVTQLSIPPLRAGDYVAEIELVAVIAPDVLEQLMCRVSGVTVIPSIDYVNPPKGFPVVLGLQFRSIEEAQPRSIQIDLEFPRSVMPSELGGSDDIRRLTACFRTVRIIDARLNLR